MMMTQETDLFKGENGDLSALLAEMQSFVRHAAQQGLRVHEVELALWRRVLKLGQQVLGQFFRLLGTGDLGATVALPDGQTVQRLPQPHARRYVSIFGEFQLCRTVYGSREGQKIALVPLDNRLQLPPGAYSYVLQDWDQSLCVEQAFGPASRTIERLLGLKQSVDSLERMNVQFAKEVPAFRDQRTLPTADEEGEILVTSADGKGVGMRRTADEPPPPAHRTKGDKASRKEMAIVGAVYSVDRYVRTPEQVVAALFGDDRDAPKAPRPQPCGKQTVANLTHSDRPGRLSGLEETYLWLLEETWARNRGFVKEMVHLCDGQEALWEARQRQLPQRNMTDVLDLLHVTPRLWQAAHVFHPEKSQQAEDFVRQRVLKVLQGKSDRVVRGLREMATKHRLQGSRKAQVTKICAYLENNRERMHYDEYLAKGYPIASGVIEGACRHLVKDRMERAGMHWTREGAQAMLDARSILVNGDWEAYQTYRIDQTTARLYPFRELVMTDNYSLAA
jgi:hypothetical protein